MEIDIENTVRSYGDMVLRLAVVNTKNMAEAEDIFQEVFLQLIRNKECIQDQEHLKSWLIRVTINKSRSYLTSFWNKFTQGLGEAEEVEDEEAIRVLFSKESLSDVTRAILEMPLKYRKVIHLYYYEGFSTKEVADILGKKESTLRCELSRGRKMLEKKLGEAVAL